MGIQKSCIEQDKTKRMGSVTPQSSPGVRMRPCFTLQHPTTYAEMVESLLVRWHSRAVVDLPAVLTEGVGTLFK